MIALSSAPTILDLEANALMTDRQDRTLPTLAEEPKDFFMTLRDIAFWIRSARSDGLLEQLRATTAQPAEAFDQLYGAKSDPYGTALAQFRYQRRKYQALMSILPGRAYRDVLDIGCGLGVMTRLLSAHANRVLGIDISGEAVSQARSLSSTFPNVEFAQADISTFQDADRRFDLIVLADVIYYLSPLDDAILDAIAARIAELMAPGGLLLLVNHFFFAIDPPSRMTRHIHEAFCSSPGLTRIAEYRRAFYLATILERSA
jgi:SAM-dependent methyltransferase